MNNKKKGVPSSSVHTSKNKESASNNSNRKTHAQDNRDEYLGEITGVKLVHELMVDIMGGLIPGALFLFSILVCVVFPLICYRGLPDITKKEGYAQGWFWMVAFLTFLILSYVIGHIFYRSDIKDPDRADVKKQRDKFISNFQKDLKKEEMEQRNLPKNKLRMEPLSSKECEEIKTKYVARLLKTEIEYLLDAIEWRDSTETNSTETDAQEKEVYGGEFKISCKNAIDYLDGIINQDTKAEDTDYNNHILYILFPEEIDNTVNTGKQTENFCYANLPHRSKIVLEEYEKLLLPVVQNCRLKRFFCREKSEKTLLLCLSVCYNILFTQDELGCCTEGRCDFPYISYYKYLLKRRETELLKYVNWDTTNSRTKNKINKYKIEIQMFAAKAYSILNKNESHIRMASSSWHVAKTMYVISYIILALTFVPIVALLVHYKLSFLNQFDDNVLNLFSPGSNMQRMVIAVCFPVGILLLLTMVRQKVVSFIHYQRLREIYHTLFVYYKWKNNTEDVDYKEELLKLHIDQKKLEIKKTAAEINSRLKKQKPE